MNTKQEFFHLFDVIAAPAEVYNNINSAPRWRMPLLLLLISSVAIGWLMIPAIIEPMKKIFVSSFGEDAAESAVRGIMKMVALTELIGEPVFKLIRWIVLSVSLYYLCRLFEKEREVPFRKFFSVIAYSESIFILMSLVTMLVIYLKGIENIESSGDLSFFKGLDYFLTDKNSNPALITILSNVNPFSLWYLISVAVGVGIISGLRFRKGMFIVVISWVVWISVSIIQPRVVGAMVSWLSKFFITAP